MAPGRLEEVCPTYPGRRTTCADTEAEDKLARRHLHGGILQRMGKVMLDIASVSLLQFTLGWMPASYGRRMEQTRTKSSRSRRNGG